jgi:hypothetical protein
VDNWLPKLRGNEVKARKVRLGLLPEIDGLESVSLLGLAQALYGRAAVLGLMVLAAVTDSAPAS